MRLFIIVGLETERGTDKQETPKCLQTEEHESIERRLAGQPDTNNHLLRSSLKKESDMIRLLDPVIVPARHCDSVHPNASRCVA
jgi:hypothetical protein